MKKLNYLLVLICLSIPLIGQAQEYDDVFGSDLDIESNLFSGPVLTGKQGGYLETRKLSIGTILKSHHFNDENYNETHNGIYLNIEGWSIGTYRNSGNDQSDFITYSSNMYTHRQIEIDLVAGVADGYEGWDYAQGDYLPILGFSAKWQYLKTMMSYDVVAFGFELPLN